MKPGDRLFLSGGYDVTPAWLGGGKGYFGTLERFIPGQNQNPAALVHFDEAVAAGGVVGAYAVLELRYEGATWTAAKETVHVELCDFIPDDRRWQDRRQGKWVESHATVTLAGPQRLSDACRPPSSMTGVAPG